MSTPFVSARTASASYSRSKRPEPWAAAATGSEPKQPSNIAAVNTRRCPPAYHAGFAQSHARR